MLRAINVKLLLAILAALVLIGAAAFRIEHNTRRQADLTQQTIDEQKRFAEQVETLKKQRR
jgi:uncharacterized membrane protein YgcG